MSNILTTTKYIVGVVGGIASGKSELSKMLEELGATVFSADAIVRRLLDQPDIIEQVVALLGPDCLISPADPSSRRIDRRKVADLVFNNANERLKKLEAILHPCVRQEAFKAISQFRADPMKTILVLDIPLLIEGNWQSHCDKIIFVDASLEQRLNRAKKRGWSDEDFLRREASQMPLDTKRSYATDIIQNDGDVQSFEKSIMELSW